MSFKNQIIDILDALENIQSIILQEDFSAYHQIKKSLIDALNFLLDHKKVDAENQLLFSIRLLMEAPPNNKELGMETLTKIDSIYKNLLSLSNQF